ncbi:hypothetical protein [Methylomonas albis]|uniref:hypothetical protein n=1 Tax=Methylomonas albis TaxID=1854563 RepID=UPI0018A78475|nr:hypothetical protein [Methylomonas albis]CAD6880019.1 hypothetical protein [Methylomonas albis]
MTEHIGFKLVGRPFVAGVDPQRFFSDAITGILAESIFSSSITRLLYSSFTRFCPAINTYRYGSY